MGLRRGPNVAVPQGDLYPNGLRLVPANPNVQATVRPEGSYFQKSAGFESIRPGRNRFQKAYHGMGIHFTPQRFAEDVGEFDTLPLLVDESTSADHADIADLPGSERLDDNGALTADAVAANEGVKMAETTRAAPSGDKTMHRGNRTVADMGDREPGRPLSVAHFQGLLRNPAGAFREEYAKSPLMAIGAAGVIVGAIYYGARELERNYRSRSRAASSGGGAAAVAAPVAAVPAAALDTGGGAVRDAAQVANQAATAAGDAAQQAASAAGDVAEAAGEAVEQVTDAVSDAATGEN